VQRTTALILTGLPQSLHLNRIPHRRQMVQEAVREILEDVGWARWCRSMTRRNDPQALLLIGLVLGNLEGIRASQREAIAMPEFVLWCCVLLLGLIVPATPGTSSECPDNVEALGKLVKGMTQDEVIKLLGTPGFSSSFSSGDFASSAFRPPSEDWVYPSLDVSLMFDGDKRLEAYGYFILVPRKPASP
jgi:hypothetical protein